MARIAGPHGLRGLLRVRPYHAPCPSLAPGRPVLLARAGEPPRPATIAGVSPHGRGALLLEVEDLGDRTAAEGLAGAEILVSIDTLPPPADGEFYYHEMPGFRVETANGEPVGEITGTMHTGTTDVWIVRAGEREVLIPVVRDVVHTIDRAARRVRITPLPGLLD